MASQVDIKPQENAVILSKPKFLLSCISFFEGLIGSVKVNNLQNLFLSGSQQSSAIRIYLSGIGGCNAAVYAIGAKAIKAVHLLLESHIRLY